MNAIFPLLFLAKEIQEKRGCCAQHKLARESKGELPAFLHPMHDVRRRQDTVVDISLVPELKNSCLSARAHILSVNMGNCLKEGHLATNFYGALAFTSE